MYNGIYRDLCPRQFDYGIFSGFDDICMADTDGKYSLEQILHELYALNTEGMGGTSTQKFIIKNNDKAGPDRWQSVVTLGKK